MISLTERQEEISNFLIRAEEPVAIEEISQKFNISRRSVYYDLEIIENWTKFSNLNYLQDSKQGVIIKRNSLENENLNYNTFLSPENRRNFILLRLFFCEHYLSAQELADFLSVSRNTITSDIKTIRENKNIEGVKIEGVRSHGYCISGDEEKIRLYVSKLILSIATTFELVSLVIKEEEKNLGVLLNFIFQKLDIFETKQCVKKASDIHKFWLPDIDYIRFIIYQALSVERIKNCHKLLPNSSFSKEIKESEEFIIAKSVCSNIEKSFHLEIDDSEIINTFRMLLTCNVKTSGNKGNTKSIDQLLNKTVDEMIQTIIPITSFKNKAYIKLRQDIFDHLKLTLKQLRFGILGENPLLNKIKIHYSQSYQLAEKMATIFQKNVKMELPETEIGFIALHIAVYLEASSSNRKNLRAIVICNSGQGSANILSKRLKTYLPDIEIKGNYSILQVEENESILHDIDLIISTIKYINNSKPVLTISPLLTDSEISLIRNCIFINDPSVNNFQSQIETKQSMDNYLSSMENNHPKFYSFAWNNQSERNSSDNVIGFQSIDYENEFANNNYLISLIILETMNMIAELGSLDFKLAQEEITGLLIHMVMSFDRWERSDFFEEQNLKDYQDKYPQMFFIVKNFLSRCATTTNNSIPESEAISILRYFI